MLNAIGTGLGHDLRSLVVQRLVPAAALLLGGVGALAAWLPARAAARIDPATVFRAS